MKFNERFLKALSSRRGAATTSSVRRADEKRAAEAAKAWNRPGGPIDPGFEA